MLGGRQYLHAVVLERLLVDRRFILIAGEAIELVNCHIFLWTVFSYNNQPSRKDLNE